MKPTDRHPGAPLRAERARWHQRLWLVLVIVYAVALGWHGYDRLTEAGQQARSRLIESHRLWELQPGFRGPPQMWTRIASRLLNDTQLMSRIHARYGTLAEQIELEYRRDLAIARAEIVLTLVALWATPILLLWGAARLLAQRKPAVPPPKAQPSSAADPRYQAPAADE